MLNDFMNQIVNLVKTVKNYFQMTGCIIFKQSYHGRIVFFLGQAGKNYSDRNNLRNTGGLKTI